VFVVLVLGQFPEGLERTLACIDEPLIRLAQKAKGKFFYYLNMALTCAYHIHARHSLSWLSLPVAVALEICVALPIFCFVVGWDGLAVDILYSAVILAFLSQARYSPAWPLNSPHQHFWLSRSPNDSYGGIGRSWSVAPKWERRLQHLRFPREPSLVPQSTVTF